MTRGRRPRAQITALQLVWIVDGLRAVGADVPAILERAGIDATRLEEPGARFEPSLEFDLWDAAIEVTGDPCVGLHIARAMRPGAFGTVDYLLRHTATVREALQRCQQFARLVDPRFSVELRPDPRGERVRIEREGGFPQPDVECLFATVVLTIRRKAPGHEPTEVCFVHRRRGPLAIYSEYFPGRVVFAADHNELLFAAGSLDAPLRGVDLALGRVLEQHAIRMLEELPDVDPLLSEARRALLADMEGPGPSLDALAARLHMSTRTLRRRLQEQGTSYKALLDELRRELGMRYVASSDHGFEEVAARLGYVDSRAFYRNFKRWTGVTPATYRKAHAADA